MRLKKNSSSLAATSKLSYMTDKLGLHINVNFKTKLQKRRTTEKLCFQHSLRKFDEAWLRFQTNSY